MKIIVPILFTAFLMTLGMIFKNRGYYLVSNVAVLDGVMEPLKNIIIIYNIVFVFISKNKFEIDNRYYIVINWIKSYIKQSINVNK